MYTEYNLLLLGLGGGRYFRGGSLLSELYASSLSSSWRRRWQRHRSRWGCVIKTVTTLIKRGIDRRLWTRKTSVILVIWRFLVFDLWDAYFIPRQFNFFIQMKKAKAVRRKTTRYYSFPLLWLFFRSQFLLSSLLIPLCWSWFLACVILSLAYSRAVVNQKPNTSIERTEIKLMKLKKVRRKKKRNHHGTKKAMKEKRGEKAKMVMEKRKRNAEVNTFVPKRKRRNRTELRMKCSDKKLR